MHFLFVKESLAWPRSSGHDVHSYHMMRALQQAGHPISLVTSLPLAAEAVAGLDLAHTALLEDVANGHNPLQLPWLQERFRSYWGVEQRHIQSVGKLASDWRADVVVAVGLEVLPYLAAVQNAGRIWYAADEWIWHHLSLLKLTDRSTWGNVRHAAIKGLYERAYARCVDRTWVVSQADGRAMRWLAGMRHVDVVANGVDAEHYQASREPPREATCVFWGRLDFEPNIQALQWFCHRVWPIVREQRPDAQLNVFGFSPGPEVRRLQDMPGVRVTPDLPDLRGEISRNQVVVLPFHSGGGIKNKLLEAASMGKPILCSARACNGLALPAESPLLVARTPDDWCRKILRLWADADLRQQLGTRARQWVRQQHSWEAAAAIAARGAEQTVAAN